MLFCYTAFQNYYENILPTFQETSCNSKLPSFCFCLTNSPLSFANAESSLNRNCSFFSNAFNEALINCTSCKQKLSSELIIIKSFSSRLPSTFHVMAAALLTIQNRIRLKQDTMIIWRQIYRHQSRGFCVK